MRGPSLREVGRVLHGNDGIWAFCNTPLSAAAGVDLVYAQRDALRQKPQGVFIDRSRRDGRRVSLPYSSRGALFRVLPVIVLQGGLDGLLRQDRAMHLVGGQPVQGFRYGLVGELGNLP